MTGREFISGESLRTRMSRFSTAGGWSEPRPFTDLRGAPIGDTVEAWTWGRLVLPRPKATRRVRQHIEAMHCPEGWYCVSGAPDRPMDGGATCSTILERGWADRHAFNAYHAEHPVVWRITVRTGQRSVVHRYCDPELPDEYRPAFDLPVNLMTERTVS